MISESFTSTGAIAMVPAGFGDQHMTKAMGSAKGKGVATRTATTDDTGKAKTDMTDMGKEWPREQKNKGGAHEACNEDITIDDIAQSIEGIADLRDVFAGYARQANFVTLNEFCELCQAHRLALVPDEDTFIRLMAENPDYMFEEHRDAQGPYWIPTIIENAPPAEFQFKAKGDKDGESDEGGEDNSGGGGGESKSKDSTRLPPWKKGKSDGGGNDGGNDDGGDDDKSKKPWEGRTANQETLNEMGGMGMGGGGMARGPGVGMGLMGGQGGDFGMDIGAQADYEVCPECSGPMDGGMCSQCGCQTGGVAELDGSSLGCPECGGQMGEDGMCMECNYSEGDTGDMAGAGPMSTGMNMNMGGGMGAGGMGGMGYRESIESIAASLNEEGKANMESPDGSGVEDSGTGKADLPKEKADTSEMGKEWPRKQKNTGSAQEDFGNSKHTEASDGITKSMGKEWPRKQKNTGGQHEPAGGVAHMSGTKKMYENISRLATHTRQFIRETIDAAGDGLNDTSIEFLVGGGDDFRARNHNQLSEALADVEELLQVLPADAVVFEMGFYDKSGDLVHECQIPLCKIAQRGPLVAENQVLFRFPELAHDFADRVVSEGVTCRAVSHNWGSAVLTRLPYERINRFFAESMRRSRQSAGSR